MNRIRTVCVLLSATCIAVICHAALGADQSPAPVILVHYMPWFEVKPVAWGSGTV